MAGYGSSNARSARNEKRRGSGIKIEVILFSLFRSWWIVLIGCLVAAMASYIFISESYKPKYYAEATFVVSSKDGGADQVYSNLVVASKLADSFTYVLESPVLKQKIAESLGMDSFEGTIKAKSIVNTNLIQIGVEAGSPQTAFYEMDGIIKYHSIVSDNLLGNVVLDVLKAPTVPTAPVEKLNKASKIMSVTGISAAVIVALIVIATVVSDDVMTESDLETKVDCPALATIYHERKNLTLRARLQGVKTSMLITNPTTSFRFAETYRLFRTRIEYMMRQKGYKVMMVSSVLENEGKTTCAANTAITLAMDNNRVLLIDGDMIKPALYKVMNVKVKRGMAINEVITSDIAMDSIPRLESVPELSLLMGKSSLSNSTELIGSREMKDFIERAKEHFDYVIIDTPPIALATDAECFAELADCTLLVIKQGGARAKRINESIEAVSQSGTEILGCIFNNVYPLEFLSDPVDKQYGGEYRTAGQGRYSARDAAEGGETRE